jgi:hypothetical protein
LSKQGAGMPGHPAKRIHQVGMALVHLVNHTRSPDPTRCVVDLK